MFNNDTGSSDDSGTDVWLTMCWNAFATPGSDELTLFFTWD